VGVCTTYAPVRDARDDDDDDDDDEDDDDDGTIRTRLWCACASVFLVVIGWGVDSSGRDRRGARFARGGAGASVDGLYRGAVHDKRIDAASGIGGASEDENGV
jgi:hypothetical protein